MKMVLSGIVGVLLGIVLMGMLTGFGLRQFVVVETVSPFDFDTTVHAIQQAVAQKGWKVPSVHDLQKTMKKNGYDVLPVSVIELCHPTHASRILKDDQARMVSSFMPCRVSVYETSDGRVVISRMNSSLMSRIFPTTIAEVMADATSEVENILLVAQSPTSSGEQAVDVGAVEKAH